MIININQIKGFATRVKKERPLNDNTWMLTCAKCGISEPMDRNRMMEKEILCDRCRKAK